METLHHHLHRRHPEAKAHQILGSHHHLAEVFAML
jgi:hypothetical protein